MPLLSRRLSVTVPSRDGGRRRAQAATAAKAADPAGGADVLDRLRVYFHELAVITEERPVETREMLFGYLRACGPVLCRSPMGRKLRAWLADDRSGSGGPSSRLDLAAEILYDVYMGALWRWMRDAAAPPGVFTTELDAAIEVAIGGIAASLAAT